ncbi:MAG: Motility protein B [Pelotomaculum sp. PtaU1.Bin035]|nr:MAG: Motility protein B [Pelotomaculum sp. PtaU1.Bin035]
MRKKQQESAGNHERWLLTYSDLITLLMIFFVVMYALSSINSRKFQAMAISMAKAMGGGQSVLTNPGASLAPGVSGEADIAEANELERIKTELQEYIDQNGLAGKVSVNIEDRGVVLSFQDVALFPLGSAQLAPSARNLIVKVGQILLRSTQYIRVEGHTDNLPINTREFPSNWELSVARSTSVVQELIRELNFPPWRLSASGYGEFRPRAPNDSVDNRQQNRRVDIVVLRSKYETAEPMSIKPPDINKLQ